MTNHRSRLAGLLLALVVALLGGAGVGMATAAAAHPVPASTVLSAQAQPDCGDLSGFDHVALSDLPSQADDTYQLIQSDGPYPYPDNDGVVFDNREGILPDCSSGYYHEYTVITPGSSNRGTRRIVTGSDGEYFYTDDHYESFRLIDVDS